MLISDENDEFPEITGTFTADLIEEQPIGATVPLTMSATDADDGDELQFSLSGRINLFKRCGSIRGCCFLRRWIQANIQAWIRLYFHLQHVAYRRRDTCFCLLSVDNQALD